jgi:DNA-binding transcriptional ArsR family regulator
MTIDLDGVDEVPVRLGLSPYSTLVALTADALGRWDLGGLPAQRRIIRDAIAKPSGGALRLLGHPATFHIWDGLLPVVSCTADRPYEAWDHIVTNADAFREDMDKAYDGNPPAHWRPALAAPHRFFEEYVASCRAVWASVRPMLGDPQRLLDREAERVGSAAVRRAVPELLSSILPGAKIKGSKLLLPARRTKQLRIPRDGLTIGPMLASVRRGAYTFDGDTLTALWYPMPGIGSLFESRLPSSARSRADGLVALLGQPRATLLRHLDHSATVGQLAVVLGGAASAVTYHVDALVAAGLVDRYRRGRHMLVTRTIRGDRLLDLYPW